MGGVINLIKKLFSGIFSFIGGIFGGKKSGYYMELDDAELSKLAAKASEKKDELVEDAKAAIAAVKSAAKSAADSVTDSTKDTVEGAKHTVAATETSAKSAVKSAKSNAKSKVSSKAEPVEAEPVKAEIAETNGSVNGSKPPVAAETLNLPQPTVSFASEYLVPKPTNSRRRPGANMGTFLEMAKTVKTPNN